MINDLNSRGIYIHIPFCRAKCGYCDFYSVPLADTDWLEKYTRGLAVEIEQRASFYDGKPIRTIYLGGGTPSLLTPTQIEKLLTKLDQFFPLDSDIEVTMEANPINIGQPIFAQDSSAFHNLRGQCLLTPSSDPSNR